MMDIEDKYLGQDLNNPTIRKTVKEEILRLIAEYRGN